MITAQQAKEIALNVQKSELDEILYLIQQEARKGKRILYMNSSFSRWESDLKSLGFVVNICTSSIAIQKDNYHGSITW